MFLKISLIPLLVASFLSITSMSTTNKVFDQAPWDVKKAKIITSLPEEDIQMYALDWKREEEENNGVYKEILLYVKGHGRYFSCWKVINDPSYKPEFVFSDINNDGNKELIVISVSGTGTGLHWSDVHVFRFDEEGYVYDVYVMDSNEGIYQNVKTRMTKKNGIVTIAINVKGKEHIIKADESSLGTWGDDVGFGNIVRYAITDNKLTVTMNAAVGNGVTCGYIFMDYIFENKRLKVNNVRFEKVDDKMFKYQF
jgi:hypothetical protein